MDNKELKKEVAEKITAAIKRDRSADRGPLVASLTLETGFTNTTIDKIIENMIEAKQLTDNLGVLNIVAEPDEQPAGEV